MLTVDDSVLERTLADLRVCLPSEGVGLWSGREANRASTWRPLCNVARDSRVRYEVHPQEWIEALYQIEQRGERPLALVHSHPTAEAVPSRYDREHWQYPNLLCVIVSFAGTEPVWNTYPM